MDYMRISYNAINRGARYHSHVFSENYGSYYHENLAIYCSGDPFAAPSLRDKQQRFESAQTVEQRVDIAMQGTAWLHELRHFHDCFGTSTGIYLFGSYLLTMQEFINLARYLYQHRIPWRLPLREWSTEPSCPDPVQMFVQNYESLKQYEGIFNGSIIVPRTQGLTNDIWRQVEIPELNITFPVYCVSLGTALVTDKSRPHETIEAIQGITHYYPLGFECLLEGSALHHRTLFFC